MQHSIKRNVSIHIEKLADADEVELHLARLILGWVTIHRHVILVFNYQPRQLSLAFPHEKLQ